MWINIEWYLVAIYLVEKHVCLMLLVVNPHIIIFCLVIVWHFIKYLFVLFLLSNLLRY